VVFRSFRGDFASLPKHGARKLCEMVQLCHSGSHQQKAVIGDNIRKVRGSVI